MFGAGAERVGGGANLTVQFGFARHCVGIPAHSLASVSLYWTAYPVWELYLLCPNILRPGCQATQIPRSVPKSQWSPVTGSCCNAGAQHVSPGFLSRRGSSHSGATETPRLSEKMEVNLRQIFLVKVLRAFRDLSKTFFLNTRAQPHHLPNT